MQTGHNGFFGNIALVILLLGLASVIYRCKNVKTESDYYSPEVLATHDNGEHYVGSQTCRECHAAIFKDYINTAHFNTSAIADSVHIKGSFKEGENILDLKDVEFTMLEEKDSFYQHTRIKNRATKIPPSKFDIVIGSGVRGQSYLSWDKDALYQLQASYYTPTDGWVNSPGYPTYYDEQRPVRDACLKCHVTFAKPLADNPHGNRFNKNAMIYGIDCERCHGPSAKHVAFHRQNPGLKVANYTLKIDSLSRQRQLDLCAQCHSGLRNVLLKGGSFSYLPGKDLSAYSKNMSTSTAETTLDVHGNQYGLLIESSCFKETTTMDCSSCHEPHKKERGNTGHFNSKCMECHNTNVKMCTVAEADKNKMSNSCIACHMPAMPSRSMMVQLPQDSLETSFKIRTHLIAIYAKELWEE